MKGWPYERFWTHIEKKKKSFIQQKERTFLTLNTFGSCSHSVYLNSPEGASLQNPIFLFMLRQLWSRPGTLCAVFSKNMCKRLLGTDYYLNRQCRESVERRTHYDYCSRFTNKGLKPKEGCADPLQCNNHTGNRVSCQASGLVLHFCDQFPFLWRIMPGTCKFTVEMRMLVLQKTQTVGRHINTSFMLLLAFLVVNGNGKSLNTGKWAISLEISLKNLSAPRPGSRYRRCHGPMCDVWLCQTSPLCLDWNYNGLSGLS